MPSGIYLFIPSSRTKSQNGQTKKKSVKRKIPSKDFRTNMIATNFAWEQLNLPDWRHMKGSQKLASLVRTPTFLVLWKKMHKKEHLIWKSFILPILYVEDLIWLLFSWIRVPYMCFHVGHWIFHLVSLTPRQFKNIAETAGIAAKYKLYVDYRLKKIQKWLV